MGKAQDSTAAKNTPRTINWFEKLIEVAVVVLGITLAFVLEREYESYKNRNTARFYLNGLKEDVNADMAQLDSVQKILKIQQKHLQRLAGYLPHKKISGDSLILYLSALSRLSLFEMRVSTFKSLQSTGQTNLLPEVAFRRQLFDYYHKSEELKLFQQVLKDYFNRYIVPLLIEKTDMDSGQIIDRTFFQSLRFKNIVLGFISLLEQQQHLYNTIIQDAKKLHKRLTLYAG